MNSRPGLTLLDGPMGTQLAARGVTTALPLWSAAAIDLAAETIAAIHRDYASAGASVHTANTFRTKRRTAGQDWRRLTQRAVELARQAGPGGRVAGSIAPLEDCYRPDLSPPSPYDEHAEMADELAQSGCDLLLCETFAHVDEAIQAVRAAISTGLETWLALTAGPQADLLSPPQMAAAGKRAVDAGATAVLVNCVPASKTLPLVSALESARLGVPIGAYANAGSIDEGIGWQTHDIPATAAYVKFACQWIDAGATIVGGCCGTGPAHIEALSRIEQST